MTATPVPEALPPLLATLEPYADEFVLIGGWVPHLYREFAGIPWTGKLSRTTELDVVVRESLPPVDRPQLRVLLEQAGLRPRPGATHGAIWEHADNGADALELLTPRTGPITGPQTKRIEHQDGIGAIMLTDLDLAIHFVEELRVPLDQRTVRVRVPTLGAYVATKAMTFAARTPQAGAPGEKQKRGKDLVYIYDVMMAGTEARRRIERDLAAIAARGKPFTESLRKGGNHLNLLRGAALHPALADAVALMVQRDAVSSNIALAAIKGATEDLLEMLDEAHGRAR